MRLLVSLRHDVGSCARGRGLVMVVRGRMAAFVVGAVLVLTAGILAVSARSAESHAIGGGDPVVAEAQSWLGVPYVYGGASRSGVDCSGFTMAVYGAFGVSLPHNAAAQAGSGVAVSSPSAGDLVLSDYTGAGIGHAGIATGDGNMINAPYPGTTVRYDPIIPENVVAYRSIV